MPPAGGAMLAVSRTVKGDRMTAFEFLRIVERDGGLVYVAQPGGRPPTEFVLTAIGADSATFENPAHDFPKRIRYAKRADGSLEASVSDGKGKGETLVFRRAPPGRAAVMSHGFPRYQPSQKAPSAMSQSRKMWRR
jgi:hypothetical protein